MNCVRGPDAVAIFGSVARGDSDGMSDRDILIVSDERHCRRRSAALLRRRGWSPVCFTWRRFDRATAGRGLFVQHLKLESRVLSDRTGRFRDSLNRFSAAPEYNREIAGSHELLGVLEKIPNSLRGRYWALDVLLVGLRTLGVATLANHGIYEFSLPRIVDSLKRVGVLAAQDRNLLLGIREYKWRHRNQKRQRPISLNETLKLIDLVSRRFRLGLHPRSIGPEEAIDFIETNDDISANWYLRSRLVERALLALRPRATEGREVADAKRQLEKVVKEPSQYGWRVKTEWPLLVDRVRSISTASDVGFS